MAVVELKKSVFIVFLACCMSVFAFLAACSLAGTDIPEASGPIMFVSEGSVFAPIITLAGPAEILWTWADGTTSASAAPTKDYGFAASRINTLYVTPWSALRRINLGYTAEDGGSYAIELCANQQVSSVSNLRVVASTLVEWCSAYNAFTTLDFSNFTSLATVECYSSTALSSINLSNTPALRRLCVEYCALSSLDLSGCPALQDLRGAINVFPTTGFGSIGADLYHMCVRDNSGFTHTDIFHDMSQFPGIAELYIWNDRQAGAIAIPSTSATRNVEILAWGNSYSSLNLAGSLDAIQYAGTVNFSNNRLASVDITGCTQINSLNLANNQLDATDVDQILAHLDSLGRSNVNTPSSAELVVDLRGNSAGNAAALASAQNLAARGWTVYTAGFELTPSAPQETGSVTISFSTTGDTTSMLCTYAGTYDLIWHWSDGTVTAALSGVTVTKSGLGAGVHNHTMTISNGAALTRFGAAPGGGQGHLVNVTGLADCGYLVIVYAYNEPDLASIGRTNTTRVREFHLMSTGLSTSEMDQLFADAVATTVTGGIFYCANRGTTASDADRATLVSLGWTLN